MKPTPKFTSLEPLEDRIAPATFVVTNTNDSGVGSLRQAILNANTNGNPATVDLINFNIGGFGPYTINLLSALPSLSQAVTIDGASEPDFDGRPVVVLDGTQTVGVKGLFITGSNVTVRALTIHGFDQAGIEIGGAGNTVQGCFIGTDETGTIARPNGGDGIRINSANNIIGGNAVSERNVISGNLLSGVNIVGSSASGNIVQGNYIGTNLVGSLQIPNSQGVSIVTGGNNLIGGSLAGEGNVISGNNSGDITISTSSGNVVAGNIIGLDKTAKLNMRSYGSGVSIFGGSNNNTIGGTLPGAKNIIAGHDEFGAQAVFIAGGDGNSVLGNIIGTNATNDIKLGNVFGVSVIGASDILIANNVIANHQGFGVQVVNSTDVQLMNNKIGTNTTGMQAFGNGTYGVRLESCQQTTIMGNTVSGNGADGLLIFNSTNGVVQGNFLGTSASGVGDLGNGLAGIAFVNCGNFLVGGSGAGQGNVISGNNDNGVYIYSAIAGYTTTVQGNKIGTDVTGEVAVPNAGNGVWIQLGNGNIIGGDQPGQGNLVSGNGRGIITQGSNTIIQGNIVGLDKDAMTPIPNSGPFGGHGIQVSGGNNNMIGGTTSGAANIVAGNAGHGVFLQNGNGNMVQGNLIGTNAAGASGLGNTQRGVMITNFCNNSVIGGAAPGSGNVISGNATAGIEVGGNSSTMIQKNLIGLTPNGMAALPNTGGVLITGAATNAVLRDNTISGNAFYGVDVLGSGHHLLGNKIGTNAPGTAAVPNVGHGLIIDNAVNVTVGGSGAGEGNLLAGNTGSGLLITGSSHGITVRANSLGLAAIPNGGDGLLLNGAGVDAITVIANNMVGNAGGGARFLGTSHALTLGNGNTLTGNLSGGVIFDGASNATVEGNTIQNNQIAGVRFINGASNNLIGGDTDAAGNNISGNAGAGVLVESGGGNRISHNVFAGNAGLAIDLGAVGATANDLGDADAGANGLQNKPQIVGAALVNGATIVSGSFSSAPNGSYRLEFYSGTNGAVSHFVAAFDVMADASGVVPILFNLGTTIAGETISAIATNLTTGDTSEFSNVSAFVPALTISDAMVIETDSEVVNAVFTITLSTAPTMPLSFDFATVNGTATSGFDFTGQGGTLQLDGLELTTTIVVPVLADDLAEMAEKFSVVLSNALNVVVLDGLGEGTILNDDTTLTISANKKVATWRDLDGDLVTLKSTKPILSVDDFVFIADGNGGEQLAALLLSDDGAAAAKAGLKLSAKRTAQMPAGDGLAHLGFLDATGIDLGAVSVSGDIARIVSGDANVKTAALASLSAGSMGFFGLATQGAGGSLSSDFTGKTGAIKIRGDLVGAELCASTSLGKIKVGGDLRGDANGRASLIAGTKLAGLLVAGRVERADILAGFDDLGATFNPDAAIGAVKVGGDWLSSNLLAGAAPGADGQFGTADDVKASATAGYTDNAKLVARIASITIGGYVAGTDAAGDGYAFVAEQIAKVKVSGVALPLQRGAGNDNLGGNLPVFDVGKTGDVIIREVA